MNQESYHYANSGLDIPLLLVVLDCFFQIRFASAQGSLYENLAESPKMNG
jgi:hypothetical protein